MNVFVKSFPTLSLSLLTILIVLAEVIGLNIVSNTEIDVSDPPLFVLALLGVLHVIALGVISRMIGRSESMKRPRVKRIGRGARERLARDRQGPVVTNFGISLIVSVTAITILSLLIPLISDLEWKSEWRLHLEILFSRLLTSF